MDILLTLIHSITTIVSFDTFKDQNNYLTIIVIKVGSSLQIYVFAGVFSI